MLMQTVWDLVSWFDFCLKDFPIISLLMFLFIGAMFWGLINGILVLSEVFEDSREKKNMILKISEEKSQLNKKANELKMMEMELEKKKESFELSKKVEKLKKEEFEFEKKLDKLKMEEFKLEKKKEQFELMKSIEILKKEESDFNDKVDELKSEMLELLKSVDKLKEEEYGLEKSVSALKKEEFGLSSAIDDEASGDAENTKKNKKTLKGKAGGTKNTVKKKGITIEKLDLDSVVEVSKKPSKKKSKKEKVTKEKSKGDSEVE
uniref:M-ORF protein n=1 Tax=Lampsilis powellii TaxID=106594 RepID=A0A4Y1KQ31_9BIVA|nr:M-ORF protein [Lampsilis powellii]